MVAPTDQDLVTESGETRRKFLDIVISQVDRGYLEALIQYHQVLSHRNALLKDLQRNRSGGQEMLEIWDEKLIRFGTLVFQKRKEFVADFIPHFGRVFEAIAGPNEPAEIAYESKLSDADFGELLRMSRSRDLEQGYTSTGVHKDDLMIRLKGLPVRKYASQGQQKSVVTSLKLAQFSYLVAKGFTRPIVLLDDIFDKLDRDRVSRLLELVTGDTFGQVFITDTDPDRVVSIFSGTDIAVQVFHVEDNTVHAVSEVRG